MRILIGIGAGVVLAVLIVVVSITAVMTNRSDERNGRSPP